MAWIAKPWSWPVDHLPSCHLPPANHYYTHTGTAIVSLPNHPTWLYCLQWSTTCKPLLYAHWYSNGFITQPSHMVCTVYSDLPPANHYYTQTGTAIVSLSNHPKWLYCLQWSTTCNPLLYTNWYSNGFIIQPSHMVCERKYLNNSYYFC